MKTLFLILIFFITQSCSFDNKSGIWNNENVISDKEKTLLTNLKNYHLLIKFSMKI